ncbi:hypothetical protein P168DRAFT_272668 [Aspergillus campestris IBT 28561]|uniref:S-adenosyl-L-methionine-dependent methyltransferase n=1 Tax=Aspergillus campestris (strain IBT 28561) TaxID=1392248 RepID=A0A2I1CWA8_ASPC2|nr:uncharacterized protein P168DRAFT_272668 [Aspergillus campestris IBT 28561]PKY01912.1 hypothetical protein P168DRAFT_272668 [Aspergillus campestris IBT 28561]
MGFWKLITQLLGRIVRFFARVDEKKLYGLDHAILNLEVPPPSMWMNMGYWEHTDSFREACEALLDQVLIAANLLDKDGTAAAKCAAVTPAGSATPNQRKKQRQRHVKLVDVGIGCGDQTLYLTRKLSKPASTPAKETGGPSDDKPLFDSYVGITIAETQADFARERLLKTTLTDDHPSPVPNVKIFAADAADPLAWGSDLTQAVLDNSGSAAEEDKTELSQTGTTKDEEHQTWLLALDTLYHFKPSRKPLLKFARQDMRASFMAFDLLISDRASLRDRLILRSMCLVTGIPYSNFMTRKEYEDMLVETGYERDMVDMKDISEHVFAGIARDIWKKDEVFKRYGVSMGMGKFRGAAKVFNWWAKSGVVRGFVVVARRGDS